MHEAAIALASYLMAGAIALSSVTFFFSAAGRFIREVDHDEQRRS